ncbi:MAG: hypothetical protein M3303_14205, partial [Gemmatimonadota bacterium]|nr:hypothetical protein [Gemmatimonadota bacterium]
AVADAIPSIAVLPFANIGGDTANQYFADGMAEELTAALQKVPGLRVLSRRSSFAFRDSTGMDVRRIGGRLGAGAVVEGSVRREGDRVHVTVALTNVRDGVPLWSGTYERARQDVFAVQDEVTRAIAGALSLTLSDGREWLAPRRTRSLEAHELYLRGRFLFNNASSERNLRQAVTFYERAIAADSGHALAWAGIAEAWAWLADWHVAPTVAYPRAKAAAFRALALDSTLAEAHALLAAVQAAHDWDFAGAQRSAARAIALNPNSGNALVSAAMAYLDAGSVDSAVSVSRRARMLDPLGASTGYVASWVLTLAGRPEETIREARTMLALDAEEPLALWVMGQALEAQDRRAEALEYLRRAAAVAPTARADYARTLAALGRRDEARRILRALEREADHRYVSPVAIGSVYLHLGDDDAAFRWLERAYRARSAEMTTVRVRPEWARAHKDPRFQAILRRVWRAG